MARTHKKMGNGTLHQYYKKAYCSFFTSSNLLNWTETSRVQGVEPAKGNHLFECNDFFELPVDGNAKNKKWVLTGANGKYDIGSFDGKTFTPEIRNLLGIGGNKLYAGRTYYNDPLNRRVDISWWKTNPNGTDMPFTQSYTLPAELKLVTTKEGVRLTRTPVIEINKLRTAHHNFNKVTVSAGGVNPFAKIKAELAEIRVKFAPSPNSTTTFSIRGESLTYVANTNKLSIADIEMDVTPLNGKIDLIVYTDRAGLEIFANEGIAYIPYAKDIDPKDLSYQIAVSGNAVTFDDIDLYKLKSAWPSNDPAGVSSISYPTTNTLLINKSVNITTKLNNVVPAKNKFTFKIAGSGFKGYQNGDTYMAKLLAPIDMAWDAQNNMYVVEDGNNIIRKITPEGIVSLFAGSETQLSGGQDGKGSNTTFNTPISITTHPLTGELYVADANLNCIRKIALDGTVSWFAGSKDQSKGTETGTPEEVRFNYPCSIVFDAEGNMYVAEKDNHVIKKYSAKTKSFSIYAGSTYGYATDVAAKSAKFWLPTALAIDTEDNIYVADRRNYRIRKISAQGFVTTVAGNATNTFVNGKGENAGFVDPIGITVATDGKLYVSDYTDHKIRVIDTKGNVNTFLGDIGKGNVDGDPNYAKINTPFGLKFGPDGNLYFAERNNNDVKMIVFNTFFIDKPLPKGLKFDTKTGVISGTPTVLAPSASYKIGVYNNYGRLAATATLKLEVVSALPASKK